MPISYSNARFQSVPTYRDNQLYLCTQEADEFGTDGESEKQPREQDFNHFPDGQLEKRSLKDLDLSSAAVKLSSSSLVQNNDGSVQVDAAYRAQYNSSPPLPTLDHPFNKNKKKKGRHQKTLQHENQGLSDHYRHQVQRLDSGAQKSADFYGHKSAEVASWLNAIKLFLGIGLSPPETGDDKTNDTVDHGHSDDHVLMSWAQFSDWEEPWEIFVSPPRTPPIDSVAKPILAAPEVKKKAIVSGLLSPLSSSELELASMSSCSTPRSTSDGGDNNYSTFGTNVCGPNSPGQGSYNSPGARSLSSSSSSSSSSPSSSSNKLIPGRQSNSSGPVQSYRNVNRTQRQHHNLYLPEMSSPLPSSIRQRDASSPSLSSSAPPVTYASHPQSQSYRRKAPSLIPSGTSTALEEARTNDPVVLQGAIAATGIPGPTLISMVTSSPMMRPTSSSTVITLPPISSFNYFLCPSPDIQSKPYNHHGHHHHHHDNNRDLTVTSNPADYHWDRGGPDLVGIGPHSRLKALPPQIPIKLSSSRLPSYDHLSLPSPSLLKRKNYTDDIDDKVDQGFRPQFSAVPFESRKSHEFEDLFPDTDYRFSTKNPSVQPCTSDSNYPSHRSYLRSRSSSPLLPPSKSAWIPAASSFITLPSSSPSSSVDNPKKTRNREKADYMRRQRHEDGRWECLWHTKGEQPCGKDFARPYDCSQHYKRDHMKIKIVTDFVCNEPSCRRKRFNRKEDLVRHRRIHTREGWIPCKHKDCDKVFQNYDARNIHHSTCDPDCPQRGKGCTHKEVAHKKKQEKSN